LLELLEFNSVLNLANALRNGSEAVTQQLVRSDCADLLQGIVVNIKVVDVKQTLSEMTALVTKVVTHVTNMRIGGFPGDTERVTIA